MLKNNNNNKTFWLRASQKEKRDFQWEVREKRQVGKGILKAWLFLQLHSWTLTDTDGGNYSRYKDLHGLEKQWMVVHPHSSSEGIASNKVSKAI